ncbi:MAG TPA: hypothetical protein VGV92_08205 [Gammaproteobacteria bacterium]|nr:hypothetical protein [Gammaproteobacteria bacterium]
MAIKTSTFSGWRLSGEDADAFLKQISDPRPNPLAQAALKRGEKYAKEYIKKGFFTIKLPVKDNSQYED